MKNVLLALSLFAFVGAASANDGTKPGKKSKAAKKESCAKMAAGTSSCCMKGAKATAAVAEKAPAASATKSL